MEHMTLLEVLASVLATISTIVSAVLAFFVKRQQLRAKEQHGQFEQQMAYQKAQFEHQMSSMATLPAQDDRADANLREALNYTRKLLMSSEKARLDAEDRCEERLKSMGTVIDRERAAIDSIRIELGEVSAQSARLEGQLLESDRQRAENSQELKNLRSQLNILSKRVETHTAELPGKE